MALFCQKSLQLARILEDSSTDPHGRTRADTDGDARGRPSRKRTTCCGAQPRRIRIGWNKTLGTANHEPFGSPIYDEVALEPDPRDRPRFAAQTVGSRVLELSRQGSMCCGAQPLALRRCVQPKTCVQYRFHRHRPCGCLPDYPIRNRRMRSHDGFGAGRLDMKSRGFGGMGQVLLASRVAQS